jgi:nucleoside-diphosphate-sugar epimerase
MQKCLVTGGAGFIGSNLVERLVGDGVQVRVLDNLTTGFMENIEPFLEDVEFKQGDVRDLDTLQELMVGVEVVFHQAAVVYGDLPQLPKRENVETRPLSPYAASKLHGETYALLYGDLYGLETVCLRYFNVYGPKQDPTSPYSGVISIFMDRAVRGEPPTIFGDGDQFRDFVYVADVVQANLLAAYRDNIAGTVINIGTGSSVTVNSLWDNISQFAGVEGEPERVEARPGDIRESVADISRARELLAYEPHYSFEEGLKLTWEWYRGRSTKS